MAIVAGGAMAIMMLQITADVASKYLFNYPIPATLETVSSYYMVALVFLPLGIVTRDREHISVELFVQFLSERRQSALSVAVNVLAIAYASIIVWTTTKEALRSTRIMEAWETAIWDIQVWPTRWFVPVGFIALLAYLLLQTVDEVRWLSGRNRLLKARGRTSILDAEL